MSFKIRLPRVLDSTSLDIDRTGTGLENLLNERGFF
jgi:hypothetical protein